MPIAPRCALVALFVSLVALPAAAQVGTASRTNLGTSLGTGADGVPRYREDTGWNNSSFNDPKWAVDYNMKLNSGSAWTSVFQSDRSNAAFTAGANNLTLDLNGFTYSVKAYVGSSGTAVGKFIVTDQAGTGAALKIVNGTIDNAGSSSTSRTIVGNSQAGRLTLENATLKTITAIIGSQSGSNGLLTLNDGGKLTATNDFFAGQLGTGAANLQGAGATIEAGAVTIGQATAGLTTGWLGTVTVNNATALLHASTSTGTGDLVIDNPAATAIGGNVGLRVNAGTVLVDHDLNLSTTGISSRLGAVQINGGTVKVGGTVSMGTSTTDLSGGKVFLSGGRFEVTSPTAVTFTPPSGAGAGTRQFYWNTGTLAFSNASVGLTDTQLKSFTTQGAATYGGGRAGGTLITGQTIDAAGSLLISGSAVTLAGGTIKAATGLGTTAPINGYGTLDAVVSGSGAINQSGPSTLAIGALGGANTVTGNDVQIGHLGVDATHTGTVNSGGIVTKVGAGTQTFKGGFTANDGVKVNAGKAVFDGNTVKTSPLTVAAGATARFQNGAAGTVSSISTAAAIGATGAAHLQIDGAATHVTADAVTNNGWIELTNGGTLTVGSAASPGSLVNNGTLINGGTLTAAITGSGTIGGSGTFLGSVTVGSGATLAPGNSPGTENFTDLTFGPGGKFDLEVASALGTAGVNWDLAAVSGLLNIAATSADPFVIVLKSLTGAFAPGALAGFDPTQPFSWKFAAVTDPSKLAGFDPSKFTIDTSNFVAYNDPAGGSFALTAAGNGLSLNFTPQPAAVPEPGSALLLGFAGLAAAGWTWRGRRRTGDTPAS